MKVVSIYAGGGGFDIGFTRAGFEVIFSTDYREPACNILSQNFNHKVLCEDIRKVDFKSEIKGLGKIDVLIGGPPCPAYSKSRFYLKDKKRGMQDEELGFTLNEYFRAVKELKPNYFVFENVHGFNYKPHREARDYLVETSEKLGYNINFRVVNAVNFGVPQKRERFICIGTKKGLKEVSVPDDTHNELGTDGKSPRVVCRDVLSDLDVKLPEDENMKAGGKDHELLKEIPPGDNYLYFTEKRGYPEPKFKWRSRYRSFLLKLSPEKPSRTIQASRSNNMGPFHRRNRFLRINEIKRIQTFPDNYKIDGVYKDQRRAIGNAVPPKLAEIIANHIKNNGSCQK